MAITRFEFDAVIEKHENINAGYIEFPYDVKEVFNGRGRVKVKAFIDGFPYSGSLVRMGGGCHWLGVTKEVRKAIGKEPGDTVHVIIEEETGERKVEVPDDLMEHFQKEPVIHDYFNGLSYTNRKEYVRWIVEAKKAETRSNRLLRTVEMLRKSIKNPYSGDNSF
ncbi:MAG: YdeI/OmpD-associated family protein [Bacteroidales bacterium]|jgi:hypothetical protein|nr:YdeI/OmpD-associated family protein [Bacteroidales bacterium]